MMNNINKKSALNTGFIETKKDGLLGLFKDKLVALLFLSNVVFASGSEDTTKVHVYKRVFQIRPTSFDTIKYDPKKVRKMTIEQYLQEFYMCDKDGKYTFNGKPILAPKDMEKYDSVFANVYRIIDPKMICPDSIISVSKEISKYYKVDNLLRNVVIRTPIGELSRNYQYALLAETIYWKNKDDITRQDLYFILGIPFDKKVYDRDLKKMLKYLEFSDNGYVKNKLYGIIKNAKGWNITGSYEKFNDYLYKDYHEYEKMLWDAAINYYGIESRDLFNKITKESKKHDIGSTVNIVINSFSCDGYGADKKYDEEIGNKILLRKQAIIDIYRPYIQSDFTTFRGNLNLGLVIKNGKVVKVTRIKNFQDKYFYSEFSNKQKADNFEKKVLNVFKGFNLNSKIDNNIMVTIELGL